VVIDLGANVGSFARMAAPVIGAKGTIYCLEPLQEVFVALEQNAGLFQKWADKQKMSVGKVIAVHAGK
jgi:FkbM family methyltransferase